MSQSPEETVREERREQVERLIVARTSARRMTATLGVSHPAILADMKVIRRRWKERHVAEYDAHILNDVEALAAMQSVMMPKALAGDRLAVDRVLAVLDHRARLLGLYAPVEKPTEVVSRDALLRAVEEWEADVARRKADLGLD